MKAVAYAGEGKIRVEERPRPELLEPTDAILRVTAAAVCGTDLRLVEGKMPGFEEGVILGHEFVGGRGGGGRGPQRRDRAALRRFDADRLRRVPAMLPARLPQLRLVRPLRHGVCLRRAR